MTREDVNKLLGYLSKTKQSDFFAELEQKRIINALYALMREKDDLAVSFVIKLADIVSEVAGSFVRTSDGLREQREIPEHNSPVDRASFLLEGTVPISVSVKHIVDKVPDVPPSVFGISNSVPIVPPGESGMFVNEYDKENSVYGLKRVPIQYRSTLPPKTSDHVSHNVIPMPYPKMSDHASMLL